MQGSFLSIRSRNTRLVLLFSILLVLTAVLVAVLPQTSSATPGNAQADNAQKPARPQFVPGQALVRYRSEPLAKQKTFEKLTSSDGRQLSIQLERFDGAGTALDPKRAGVAGCRKAQFAGGHIGNSVKGGRQKWFFGPAQNKRI